MSLFSELKRRNVIRTALGYLAASWLLIQIAETIFPVFDISEAAVKLVVIVLGIGLIPVLILSWVLEWTPEGLKKDQGYATAHSLVTKHAKTWDRIILLVLALALGLFAFDKFVLAPEREAEIIRTASRAGAEQALAEERQKEAEIAYESVAVLPFVNMSGDPENEYFSDGLTETLLHMLVQLQDLQVSARTSSFAFKGKNVDIRTIAEELGVAHVLEGSVQKSGTMVRITAQLIRANDGFHVWSQNYDRELDNIFAIQDEIAKEVAAALGSSLLTASDGVIEGIATTDLSAYDIYLQGLEQYRLQHDESLLAADVLFRKALDLDPSFHDARLGLARTNMWREFKNLAPIGTTLAESYELSQQVATAHPDNLVALSLVQYFQLQMYTVNQEQDQREELKAQLDKLVSTFSQGYGDAFVRRQTAGKLAGWGRHKEALDLVLDGLRYDPLNPDLLISLSFQYQHDEKWDEALQPLLSALRLIPGNAQILRNLSNLESSRGNYVESLRWLRKAIDADPSDTLLVVNMAVRLYNRGLTEEASYWHKIAQQLGVNSQQYLLNLKLRAAKARNDDKTIIELAGAEIERVLTDELIEGIGFYGVEYSRAMHRQGRSQEAADFLTSLYPDLFDVSKLPPNWELGELKFAAFTLLEDLLSIEEFRERQRTYIATVDAAGIPWREDKQLLAIVELNQGNFERARELTVVEFSKRHAHDWAWVNLIENPWLEDLRADLEVAALIAKHERGMARLREQLNDLFLEPGWRHDQAGQ